MMTDIFKKAAQLRELQKGATTQGEAEAAARVLAAFLEKHRISLAEIELQDQNHNNLVIDLDNPIYTWQRTSIWKRYLIEVLCEHYGVIPIIHTSELNINKRGKNIKKQIALCGNKNDIAIIQHMFQWLQNEIIKIRSIKMKSMKQRSREAWSIGFVRGIKTQLDKSRQDTWTEANDSTKMILRSRIEQSEKFLQNIIPNIKEEKRRNVNIGDSIAFRNGIKDGSEFEITEQNTKYLDK